MPAPQHDRRPDVLAAAKTHGWQHEVGTTTHGSISDQFTRHGRTLTCFWHRTPWSDAYWDQGILSGPDKPRQVWRITGDDGVLAVLKG